MQSSPEHGKQSAADPFESRGAILNLDMNPESPVTRIGKTLIEGGVGVVLAEAGIAALGISPVVGILELAGSAFFFKAALEDATRS